MPRVLSFSAAIPLALLLGCAGINTHQTAHEAAQSGDFVLHLVDTGTRSPGEINFESPSRGVLTIVFTIDNPCLISYTEGKYEVKRDTLALTLTDPPHDPRRLCLDGTALRTYRTQIQSLPPGPRIVRFSLIRNFPLSDTTALLPQGRTRIN